MPNNNFQFTLDNIKIKATINCCSGKKRKFLNVDF